MCDIVTWHEIVTPRSDTIDEITNTPDANQ